MRRQLLSASQVPNFYVLFGVIAVAAAIIWASRQGNKTASTTHGPRHPPADGKPPHPMVWIAFSLFGIVFLAAGVAMCFSPGEPAAGGGKGGAILIYLAYWLLGDYGPAIAFMGLGVVCLYKAYTLLRDD